MTGIRNAGKLVTLLAALALIGGLISASAALAQGLFTQFNIWYERPLRMYSINYKKGTMIPAGTEVTGVEISRKYIKFQAGGESFQIRFYPKYHPGETSETLGQQMFGTKTYGQLTAGMTAEELDGVRRGMPIAGMSKGEIMVTLGYPPSHETPSLEINKWKFWVSRFGTLTICFDGQGLAVHCSPPKPNDLWLKQGS